MARIKAVGGRHETWIAEELQTGRGKNSVLCTAGRGEFSDSLDFEIY